MNCEPCRMLNDSPIMIVAAGDVKIDNQKYKATFGAISGFSFGASELYKD